MESDKKVHKKENGPEPFEVNTKRELFGSTFFWTKKRTTKSNSEDRPEWKAKKNHSQIM